MGGSGWEGADGMMLSKPGSVEGHRLVQSRIWKAQW
jgi:hypothetical protein